MALLFGAVVNFLVRAEEAGAHLQVETICIHIYIYLSIELFSAVVHLLVHLYIHIYVYMSIYIALLLSNVVPETLVPTVPALSLPTICIYV